MKPRDAEKLADSGGGCARVPANSRGCEGVEVGGSISYNASNLTGKHLGEEDSAGKKFKCVLVRNWVCFLLCGYFCIRVLKLHESNDMF